ncbi:flagellar hook-basal body protein [Exiguobacterium flavidum]|uniref:flagellar hook-basal body protein n=1 Tax=Exiguobacterium flavidum TaxID=2184695 RepID=UPI000DF83E2B|nr:flagellar hook-basal body protein [Exiguobacterium flavidum]
MQSFHTSASTMAQLQKMLDVTGQNLANANTNGYKRKEGQFNELLVRNIENGRGAEGPQTTPPGLRLGTGGYVASEVTRFASGSFRETGRALDLALKNKNHFFGVIDADGETKLTRDGNLQLMPTGNGQVLLTDDAGRAVANTNNERIELPETASNIQIGSDGNVSGVVGGERRIFARIGVGVVENLADLEPVGGGLFTAVGPYDVATGNPIMVGGLESSNVDMGQEMTELMQIQRAYQFNSRALSTSDQMMGIVSSLK